MNDKIYVVFDLEATCYKTGAPKDFVNEIIEIGAVKLDKNGNEIDKFSHFLKPKIHPIISDFCTELTTITQADIDKAESASVILEEFMLWCKDCILVSWGFYDINQLNKDLIKNDLEIYLDQNQHFSLKHLHAKWNNFTGKRKNGIGMSGALNLEGLELEGQHHRGIDDAINIAKIFRKYIDKF